MDLRRLLIALLCLPALLAPSGFSAVLCLCGGTAVLASEEVCCAVNDAATDEPTCCVTKSGDTRSDDGQAPVQVHAPCASCHDLTTPDGSATRLPNGPESELNHAALLPLPASFSFAWLAGDPQRAHVRPTAAHAPPLAATIPLRI